MSVHSRRSFQSAAQRQDPRLNGFDDGYATRTGLQGLTSFESQRRHVPPYLAQRYRYVEQEDADTHDSLLLIAVSTHTVKTAALRKTGLTGHETEVAMWQNFSTENNVLGPTTVEINKRTLLVRMNRALAKTGSEVVRKYRAVGHDAESGLGDYYRVDGESGNVVEMHVNLETMAREIGALRCFEELAAEPHPQHDLLAGMRDKRKSRGSGIESSNAHDRPTRG